MEDIRAGAEPDPIRQVFDRSEFDWIAERAAQERGNQWLPGVNGAPWRNNGRRVHDIPRPEIAHQADRGLDWAWTGIEIAAWGTRYGLGRSSQEVRRAMRAVDRFLTGRENGESSRPPAGEPQPDGSMVYSFSDQRGLLHRVRVYGDQSEVETVRANGKDIPIRIKTADGRQRTFDYGNGQINKVSEWVPGPNGQIVMAGSYERRPGEQIEITEDGRQITTSADRKSMFVTKLDGSDLAYSQQRDGAVRLSSVRFPGGAAATYTYDARGNLAETSDWAPPALPGQPARLVRTFRRDADGSGWSKVFGDGPEKISGDIRVEENGPHAGSHFIVYPDGNYNVRTTRGEWHSMPKPRQ